MVGQGGRHRPERILAGEQIKRLRRAGFGARERTLAHHEGDRPRLGPCLVDQAAGHLAEFAAGCIEHGMGNVEAVEQVEGDPPLLDVLRLVMELPAVA